MPIRRPVTVKVYKVTLGAFIQIPGVGTCSGTAYRQTQFVEGESFQLVRVDDVIVRNDEAVGSIARLTPRMPGYSTCQSAESNS